MGFLILFIVFLAKVVRKENKQEAPRLVVIVQEGKRETFVSKLFTWAGRIGVLISIGQVLAPKLWILVTMVEKHLLN